VINVQRVFRVLVAALYPVENHRTGIIVSPLYDNAKS